MSRWFVGSSRMSRCGPPKVASPISRRAFSPPESAETGVSAFAPENPIRAQRARTLASVESGIRSARGGRASRPGSVRRAGCCAKYATCSLEERRTVPSIASRRRRRAWRRSTCRCRSSEQPDSVVVGDRERQAREHRRVAVADARPLHRHDGRGEGPLGGGEVEGQHSWSTMAAMGCIFSAASRATAPAWPSRPWRGSGRRRPAGAGARPPASCAASAAAPAARRADARTGRSRRG